MLKLGNWAQMFTHSTSVEELLPSSVAALRALLHADDECLLPPEKFLEPETRRGQVVLLRHGESVWNKANRFTGWHDVPLSRRGEDQAVDAARKLREEGIVFDVVYVSTLKRTIKTAWLVLEELDDFSIPIEQRWQLNERMYGALTGLDKAYVREYLGDARFEQVRRDPPPIDDSSCFNPNRDALLRRRLSRQHSYRSLDHTHPDPLPPAGLPRGESFEDTQKRVRPVWEGEILAQAREGKNVLVISSKNLLRSIFLEISEVQSPHGSTREAKDALVNVDIPNAVPIHYDPLTGDMRLLDGVVGLDGAAAPDTLPQRPAPRASPFDPPSMSIPALAHPADDGEGLGDL